MRNRLIIAVLIMCATYEICVADRRSYVWTYQYLTMPKGETEMELYQTTKLNVKDEWEFRLEIEHGLTNNWDFSIYQIFKQQEGKAFLWDAVQARTRYRLGEEGLWLVDPLLYLEYNRKIDLKAPNKLEAKLILAKTASQFNLALNPVYNYYFAPGSKHELGLDAGTSWEFHPAVSVGAESTTRTKFEDGESETSSYLGPTISLASGKWWYSIGVALGITDRSDDARVRFLMGVGL